MKKLLVIRFSALGDIAMTVPVVHDLAVQYPDLDITMLSREMARPLFERMPPNMIPSERITINSIFRYFDNLLSCSFFIVFTSV